MERVRVKRITFRRNGKQGFPVQLPQQWCQDVGLQIGGTVDVFRTTDDKLIIEFVGSVSGARP